MILNGSVICTGIRIENVLSILARELHDNNWTFVYGIVKKANVLTVVSAVHENVEQNNGEKCQFSSKFRQYHRIYVCGVVHGISRN